MIDLHTHILPGVDDGVKTMDDAVAFARMAAEDGIKTIVATPHYREGFYLNTRADVIAGVAAVNERLKSEGIAVSVLPGAEVHVSADIIERIKTGDAPTLGDNGRTVLFELSMSQYPLDLENLVFRMRVAGLQVLFAHPERIRYFQDDVSRYESVVRLGSFGQITSGSVNGTFGPDVAAFSEEIARKGLVHVVASDAHNTRGRPPILSAAVDRLASWVGLDAARRMADEIPRSILAGVDPENPEPGAPVRKRSLAARLFRRG